MTDQPNKPNTPQQQLTLLWMKAQPTLAAFIRSMVRDRHHAEDLLQKVALTATDKFDQYDPEKPFAAWAMGIARNHVLDYLRSRRNERHQFGQDIVDSIAEVHGVLEPRYEPMKAALEKCMAKLQQRGRKMLEMRYLRDMDPGQIAERMGVTRNAVRIALHRVRNSLGMCIRQSISKGGDQ